MLGVLISADSTKTCQSRSPSGDPQTHALTCPDMGIRGISTVSQHVRPFTGAADCIYHGSPEARGGRFLCVPALFFEMVPKTSEGRSTLHGGFEEESEVHARASTPARNG